MLFGDYILIAASRSLALASNLLVAYVVSTHLSGVEQGFFYAFQSLGAAQFFFDLGIGFVLANVAGRHVARAHIDGRSDLEALSSVLSFSFKWSFLAGFFLYGALHIAGNYLFLDELRLVWGYYSILVALNIVNNSLLSIMEGVGRVLAVSVVRALQSAFFVITLFVGTTQGMGLQALPVSLFVSMLPIVVWLVIILWPVMLTNKGGDEIVQWRRDIFPFQWRVAISWIAGYFVFQAPISFIYKAIGPVEAGQLGLSMQIFQALTTLASILLSTRMKAWTRMAVHEKYDDLRNDLWIIVRRCIGVVIVGAAILMVLRWQLTVVSPMHAARIVDTQAWLLLTFAAIANQIFYSLNYYFRAQGKEPLWIVAAAAGLAAVTAAWLSTPITSIDVVAFVYFLIAFLVHAGAGLFIYRNYIRDQLKFVMITNRK